MMNFCKQKKYIKETKYNLAFQIIEKLYNEEKDNRVIKFQYAKLLLKIKNRNIDLSRKLLLELSQLVDRYAKFELENKIGICNDVETSFVEVITICNTKNIVAMYQASSKYRKGDLYKNKTKL